MRQYIYTLKLSVKEEGLYKYFSCHNRIFLLATSRYELQKYVVLKQFQAEVLSY